MVAWNVHVDGVYVHGKVRHDGDFGQQLGEALILSRKMEVLQESKKTRRSVY